MLYTRPAVYIKKVSNDAHARPCANSNPNHNPNLGRVHMPPLSIYTAGRVYSHCVQNQINVYPDLNNSNKNLGLTYKCNCKQGRSQKLHVGGAWCAGPNPTPICLPSPTVLPSPLPHFPSKIN